MLEKNMTGVLHLFVDWARKLAQRGDGRLIAYRVAGGYLKIFEFQQSLAWARRLLARYQRDETATNELFLSLAGPAAHAKIADGQIEAGESLPGLPP